MWQFGLDREFHRFLVALPLFKKKKNHLQKHKKNKSEVALVKKGK